jgi:hypothetical protein
MLNALNHNAVNDISDILNNSYFKLIAQGCHSDPLGCIDG